MQKYEAEQQQQKKNDEKNTIQQIYLQRRSTIIITIATIWTKPDEDALPVIIVSVTMEKVYDITGDGHQTHTHTMCVCTYEV